MQRFTSSRSGTLVLGGLAALVAGALLLIYVSQVRQDANSQSATVSVLVANKLIPQSSSGDVIASQKWYSVVSTPKDQVKDGAITDPASISGKIAAHDIYPNQQLATSDFTDAPTDAVTTKLTGNQRAISIPLDSAAGLTPFLQAGDHVDILAGFNVIPIGANGAPLNGSSQARPVEKVIAQDIKVLEVPSTSSQHRHRQQQRQHRRAGDRPAGLGHRLCDQQRHRVPGGYARRPATSPASPAW